MHTHTGNYISECTIFISNLQSLYLDRNSQTLQHKGLGHLFGIETAKLYSTKGHLQGIGENKSLAHSGSPTIISDLQTPRRLSIRRVAIRLQTKH